MEEKYKKYVEAFKNLDEYDQKEEIINELKDIMNIFYKINKDFNVPTNLLPVINNTDEYLVEIFTYIQCLKKITANTINIMNENLYEGDLNE